MLMLIDGAWVGAADGAVDEIRNPADRSLIDTVPSASQADVDRAVAAAQAGKRRMAALPAHERCAILLRVADAIEAGTGRTGRLLARENGKTHRETASEIKAAIRIFRGYAEEAKRIFGRAMPLDSVPGPRGVAGHHHAPAARRRRRHRALQLSGGTLVAQGGRCARRRQRRDHQAAGGMPAHGDTHRRIHGSRPACRAPRISSSPARARRSAPRWCERRRRGHGRHDRQHRGRAARS